MLCMAGDPVIETAISKGNSFDDFNFIIDSFNGTIGIWSCESIFNIRLIHFKGLKSYLKYRRNQRVICMK